ncbi:MAG: hypothetical protein WCD76_03955 [Pyrinomonadaceae bacterium]
MKALGALFLLAACAVSILPAQTPVPQPQNPSGGVTLIKFNWSKERINWERDPFGGAVESVDEMRVRTRDEKRIEDAKRGGNSSEVERLKRDAKADAAIFATVRRGKGPPRYVFMYKASVRNDGAKEIKSIDWDYVFYDAATREELGRHQFTSDGKIGAGKSKELAFTIPTPPTRTVSAYSLDAKKERDSLAGQVILVRVEYADSTFWQRPTDAH